jgi:hypothetical protein
MFEDSHARNGTCTNFHHPMPKKVRPLHESIVKVSQRTSAFATPLKIGCLRSVQKHAAHQGMYALMSAYKGKADITRTFPSQ